MFLEPADIKINEELLSNFALIDSIYIGLTDCSQSLQNDIFSVEKIVISIIP